MNTIPLEEMLLKASALGVRGEKLETNWSQLGMPSIGHKIPLKRVIGNTIPC